MTNLFINTMHKLKCKKLYVNCGKINIFIQTIDSFFFYVD